MCPECPSAAFVVIAGLFLTSWRTLLALLPTIGRLKNVH